MKSLVSTSLGLVIFTAATAGTAWADPAVAPATAPPSAAGPTPAAAPTVAPSTWAAPAASPRDAAERPAAEADAPLAQTTEPTPAGPANDEVPPLPPPRPMGAVDAGPSEGPPTLLGANHRKTAFGGYAATRVLYSRIHGENAAMVGFDGALLLDHRLSVGLGFRGLANRVEGPHDAYGMRQRIDFGYGGLVMRYSLLGKSPVYATVGALIGGGSVTLRDYNWTSRNSYNNNDLGDGVFVVEPELQVHANFTRWFRASALVNYRYVNGASQHDGISDADLAGLGVGGSLEFGWF